MDKRIGKILGAGVREYPEVDIYGRSFTQPCTTINVGGGCFVVVPQNFSDTNTLEAIKAELKAPPKKLSKPSAAGEMNVQPAD